MTDLAALRAEAEGLSRALPGISFRSEASEAPHIGSAGRRKAGTGEHFWQYRRYAHEDAAERVDWRRSARGDELFVRETELETARTILFWCDPHPGFDWTSNADLRSKADEARVLMLTLASLFSREGERIGVLGGARGSGFGRKAMDRLSEDLVCDSAAEFPHTPKRPATLVIASDFYDPVDLWTMRLGKLARTCQEGVMLAVSDPQEEQFDFEGRVRFRRPGTTLARIFGRAETMKETYQRRFSEHRTALRALADRLGWRFIPHSTGDVTLKGAAALKRALESFEASAKT